MIVEQENEKKKTTLLGLHILTNIKFSNALMYKPFSVLK